VSGRLAASAFSASFSHRSPKFRRSAAISGELASLARRAHSAAWTWQYLAYDDMTRPLRLHIYISVRQLTAENSLHAGAHMFHYDYLFCTAVNQGHDGSQLNSFTNCCLATTGPRPWVACHHIGIAQPAW
jgi:hypothetical protein